MITKKLNASIIIASKILNYGLIFYFAVLLAKFVWWVINPSLADVYVARTSVTQFDKSVKYIINRYPFGVITAPPVAAAPPITEQLKLTGVYLNTPSNSIAFIEFNHKPMIVKIGEAISEGAVLKAINPDTIIVAQGGTEARIKLTSGNVTSGTVSQGPIFPPTGPPANNNYQANFQPAVVNENQATNPANPNAVNPNSAEFKERRRRLIEEFTQRERANNPDSANKAN